MIASSTSRSQTSRVCPVVKVSSLSRIDRHPPVNRRTSRSVVWLSLATSNSRHYSRANSNVCLPLEGSMSWMINRLRLAEVRPAGDCLPGKDDPLRSSCQRGLYSTLRPSTCPVGPASTQRFSRTMSDRPQKWPVLDDGDCRCYNPSMHSSLSSPCAWGHG